MKKMLIGLALALGLVFASPLPSMAHDYYRGHHYRTHRHDRGHHYGHYRHHRRHRDSRIYFNTGFYPVYPQPAPVYYYPPSGASINFGFVID